MIEGIIPYANCNDLKFSTAMFAAMYLVCLMPGYSQSLGKKKNPISGTSYRGKQRDLFNVATLRRQSWPATSWHSFSLFSLQI